MRVEVLNQRVHHFIGDQRLAAAIRSGLVPIDREDAFELFIGIRHRPHCLGELFTEVGGFSKHIAPAAAVRYGKAMLAPRTENRLLRFGKLAALLALQIGNSLIRLIFPLVTEPLIEHQRQNIVFVILPGSLATQDIGGSPQVCFELLLGEFHSVPLVSAVFPSNEKHCRVVENPFNSYRFIRSAFPVLSFAHKTLRTAFSPA